MSREFHATEEMVESANDLSFEEAVHYLAALAILEKHGITPAILEKWGKKLDDHYLLTIPILKKVVKENKDDFFTHRYYRSIQIELS